MESLTAVLTPHFGPPAKDFGVHVQYGLTVTPEYTELLNRMNGFTFGGIAIN